LREKKNIYFGVAKSQGVFAERITPVGGVTDVISDSAAGETMERKNWSPTGQKRGSKGKTPGEIEEINTRKYQTKQSRAKNLENLTIKS